MAANLSEVYSPELVEVMNSVEFKQWMVTERRFAVDNMLVDALLDPIPSGACRPSLQQYNMSVGRQRTRDCLESYAKQFILRNSK